MTCLSAAAAEVAHVGQHHDSNRDADDRPLVAGQEVDHPAELALERVGQPPDESEAGGNGNYGPVTYVISQALNVGDGILDTDETVNPWGARYYQVRPAASVPVIPIKITQDTLTPLFYVVLGIRGNDLVYEQAMLAEKAGRPEEMERLLREILARKPDYHHALNALGFTLADRGVRLQEAKALIIKALEYAPEDPFITDSLGWVEFRLGNNAQALLLLERAFEKRQDADIAAHLGEVLWKLGQHERAKALWKDAQQQHPDNETLRETLKRLGVAL